MLKKRYLILSLVMHLSLLIPFLFGGNESEEGKSGGIPIQVDIVQQESESEAETEPAEVVVKKPEPPKAKTVRDCEKYYEGIGVEINWQNDKLTKVVPGYPAEEAGLLEGDVITPVGERDIRGKAGTSVMIKVVRGNSTFYVTIIRDKICTENKP